MASLCKRQQCTIDRRGFRQELDSWRHKLIHCVGFESILEGLFGPELVQDLQLFKDREPLAVSDWSFDENCIFCCLRRNKVKEHLSVLNSDGLEDPPKPLLVKDQTLLIKLERQAEEFLSAVLRRKDVPNFSDPHVPVVAREILQGMIRQFAAEYTSKSSPQEPSATQTHCDQSLPCAQPLSPPIASAHNLNPVLSKLLMIDQDAPLDLTIKKPPVEPTEQDGVLDLSIKKNRNSSCLSPMTSTPKGEPREVQISKVKEVQAASTLEQFMFKLCLHHQRQIITAISFLQTESKTLAPLKSSQTTTSAHEPQASYSPIASCLPTPTKPSSEPSKASNPDSKPNTSICSKLKQSVTPVPPVAPARTIPSPNPHTSTTPATTPTLETKNSSHSDHAPLKLKIMKTGSVAAGNKLSCVLTTSLSPQPTEDKQGNTKSAETPRARLSSSFKKQSEANDTHPVKQAVGHTEDRIEKTISFNVVMPSKSPRTARKSIRPSTERHFSDRVTLDPDLGHCDIVYINKPITECFKKRHRGMTPRRNARKSTRGLMYSNEIWELKTVRTLAGRGNCPNPLLDFNSSVTPKQNLSKPEGVPPVDMPCAGECREAMDQQIITQEPTESELSETGQAKESSACDADVVVETSQTDQSQVVLETVSPSPVEPPDNTDKSVEQEKSTELENARENKLINLQLLTDDKEQSQNEEEHYSVQSVLAQTLSVEDSGIERSNEQSSSNDIGVPKESALPDKESFVEKQEKEKLSEEPNLESQVETVTTEILMETERGITEVQPTVEPSSEPETKVVQRTTEITVSEKDSTQPDVSTKTLEELAKELPPWRRRKTSAPPAPPAPKLLEKAEVIVGFVSGKPVSASDRSLRHRSGQTTPTKETPKPNKRIRKVQNKADGDSNTEPSDLAKHLSVEQEPESANVSFCPTVSSVTEQSSVKPCPKPIISPNKSKVERKKASGQSAMSTRHLRSSGQILVESPPTLPSATVSGTSTSQASVVSESLVTESKESSISVASISPPILTPPLEQTSQDTTNTTTPPVTMDMPIPKKTTDMFTLPETKDSFAKTADMSTLPQTMDTATPPATTDTPAHSTALDTADPPVTMDTSTPSATTDKSTIPVTINTPTPPQTTNTPIPSETIVESKMDKNPESAKGQPQCKKDIPVPSKPKLRSAKLVPEESKVEKAEESTVKVEPQSQAMSLRSKRTLQNDLEPCKLLSRPKPNLESNTESSSMVDSSGPVAKKTARMPLRSEANKVDLSAPTEEKRLFLRSQRSFLREGSSPIRMTKTLVNQSTSKGTVSSSKSDPPKPPSVKFLEALNGAQNQHLINNLNLKFDKMHKGWMQLDKEGQPTPKHKNRHDRQAAIWKSKRRVRKPKLMENPKYSPVQMLFMKGFDLSSICHWLLEATETKSLVIVKKVNTRLPSETQLCFHSSGASGSSQGIYPSLQAERLKKHLKKFAIASPVKNNPKTQKLIAKALEQELVGVVKGKDKKEVASAIVKKLTSSTKREPQKPKSGKSQNPASARILRKYSNIREKQANARLKEKVKVKASLKSLTKDASKSNLKSFKSTSVKKQADSETKSDKKKALIEKSNELKLPKVPTKDKAVKTQGGKQMAKEEVKKELLRRTSQRLGSTPVPDPNVAAPRNKTDKKVEEKKTVETSKSPKTKVAKVQKESPVGAQSKSADNQETNNDSKASNSPDQVQTRSQSKVEMSSSVNVTPKSVTRKSGRGNKTPTPAEKPALTRSGAIKLSAKRNQTSVLPRSASKKAQELLETPAKRTRTK